MKYLEPLYARLIALAPQVALVIVVIIAGLLLSSIAGRVVRWLTRKTGLETLAEKVGVAKLLYAVGAKDGVAELLRRLTFVAGLLLTASAVADLLKLQAVSALMALAVRYLPRLLAAGAVLVGGMAVAALLRNVVRAVGRQRDDLEAPNFVAQLTYYLILTVAVTLAADQAGLQTGVVDTLIVVVIGIGLGGVALSFALGARPMFHKLAARHYYQRMLNPGDRVRIGDVEGVVVRFSSVALLLRTGRGELIIVPCDQLAAEVVRVEPLDEPSEDAP